MGWLPSAPQLGRNPLGIKAEADKAGLSPTEFTAQALKSGDLRMACEQPDSGSNHPRNLFVWRSNLLGSSGKGHEYMQKYLLGTETGSGRRTRCQRRDQTGRSRVANCGD
ncbi:hypothetical protein ACLK11_08445 [Escherichia coli]